ncbi:hypothetical protein GCM10017744_034390 [Streptomyces antimycoticus]
MIAGNSVWAGAGEAGSRGVAAVDTRGGRLAWPYTQGTEGRWALSAAGNRVFMLHNRTLTAMPVFQPHRPAPSARQPPPAPPPDQRAPTLVIPPAPAHPRQDAGTLCAGRLRTRPRRLRVSGDSAQRTPPPESRKIP